MGSAQTAGTLYRQALRNNWGVYLAGALTLISTSITEVLTPKFIQWCLDLAATGGPGAVSRLHELVTWFGIVLVVGLVGRIGWRQLLARRTHVEGRELKVRFWDTLRFLPLRTFQDYPLGDLMNRATGDWSASRTIFGFTVVLTLDMIFFTSLSVVAMLTIDWRLTLLSLAIFPVLPRFILRLARKEHDLHVVAQEQLGHLSDRISQSLGTIRLTRATASDALWQEELAREARGYADRRFEVMKTGWKIFPLGAAPTLIAYAILIFFGGRRIASGELTIGQFVAMLSYVLMLQGPLFDMGDCIAEWQKGFASLSRITEVFNLGRAPSKVAVFAPDTARAASTVLSIRGLSFAYGDRLVLDDVSLEVAAGESVGIQGAIGTGKSTLLALAAGLVETPESTAKSKIALLGETLAAIPRARIPDLVTMVPQRSFLFAGTIRFNLELDSRYDEAEIWEALAVVRLEKDVRGFEKGLETRIGEWGVTLSGGQKQRLALARALLRRRPLLLLDDCLSAVDAVTEEAILENLGAYRRRESRQAIVWVAHRLSTLALCDRVFAMDRGRLSKVERGGKA